MRVIATLAFAMVFVLAALPAGAQGAPGTYPNKCLAGKNKCVSKLADGLLKCRGKCQNNPVRCGAEQTACEDKVKARFDGGSSKPSCFARLEARENPSRPVTVCATTGDADSMEAEVDGIVAELVARLEGTPAPTCGDDVVNVVGEQCDGVDLDGYTCASLGHPLGSLDCDSSCRFDVSNCRCAGLGGVEVGDFCWFLGFPDESCNDVCTELGLAYDDAGTRGYAGSDGTTANCFDVLEAIGLGSGRAIDFVCGEGWGCQRTLRSQRGRCLSVATTGEDSAPGIERACACR